MRTKQSMFLAMAESKNEALNLPPLAICFKAMILLCWFIAIVAIIVSGIGFCLDFMV